MAEDLGMVNLEKNSGRGRGGVDQSTSRSASIRSSAVTLPQSMELSTDRLNFKPRKKVLVRWYGARVLRRRTKP